MGVRLARELSIFADESGDRTGKARYYLLTLVLHDQANAIKSNIFQYENSLLHSDLPNIPFHSEPLLNGHDPYDNLGLDQRKKMLSSFSALVRYLPIEYVTFTYKSSEHADEDELCNRMERDISRTITERLDFFQAFDDVKVYYDNGQAIVKHALYSAVGSTLSKNVMVKKRASMTEYRLAQVADYLCTIELAALKYEAREAGATYNKFFGGIGAFKKNWLKQARRKRMK